MSRARTLRKERAQGRKSARGKAIPNEPFLTGSILNAVLGALLAVATIALYIPVVGHPFLVLDDHDYVTANSHIHEGLSWNTIRWAFSSTEAANWHPLTWLSHALDYQIFALNPAGHHCDSILIHGVNAVLLFLVLAWATKRVGPSLLVAALFAVHPLNVESVAWVAERKNVLSTLLFFMAIGVYIWYAKKPGWWRYLLALGLFAAGLMAKPMVITLPLVLLLVDYWPLERTPLNESGSGTAAAAGVPRVTWSRLLLEKVPMLFLSAGSAWITLVAQRPAERSFAELPFEIRLENAVVAYGLYLGKMVWPAQLSFYPHGVGARPAWQWVLSALVLIGVTALVFWYRRKRYLTVGWLWFLVTLIPVIGLVQVGEYAMADRYAYITLIGVFAMIAFGLGDLAEAKKVSAVWLAIPAVCALAALACVTWRQMDYWESDYDLWRHTLEGGESPMALNALAMAMMHPDSEMSQHDLESYATERSRMDEARRDFERALELRQPQVQQNPAGYLPDMARTLNNLGGLDRLENRPDEARRHGERALESYRQLAAQNPNMYLPYVAAALSNLGTLDRLQKRVAEAGQYFEEALKIDRKLAEQNPTTYLPNIAMTLNEFGFLDAELGRTDDARGHFEEALKIDRQLAEESPGVYRRDLAMTLTNFGLLDASAKRMDDARQHFEEALDIYRQLAERDPAVYLPEMATMLSNVGRADGIENRMDEARAHFAEAADIYRKLSQDEPARYSVDLARVEATLNELDRQRPTK
jgi:tetratricopeptide (TPR) repeat protein